MDLIAGRSLPAIFLAQRSLAAMYASFIGQTRYPIRLWTASQSENVVRSPSVRRSFRVSNSETQLRSRDVQARVGQSVRRGSIVVCEEDPGSGIRETG